MDRSGLMVRAASSSLASPAPLSLCSPLVPASPLQRLTLQFSSQPLCARCHGLLLPPPWEHSALDSGGRRAQVAAVHIGRTASKAAETAIRGSPPGARVAPPQAPQSFHTQHHCLPSRGAAAGPKVPHFSSPAHSEHAHIPSGISGPGCVPAPGRQRLGAGL